MLLLTDLAPVGPTMALAAPDDALVNPISARRRLPTGRPKLSKRCTGCTGARYTPHAVPEQLSDEKFLEVVINGRKRALTMPPFGYILSPDEVWQIHAFVKARDRL